MTSPDFRKMALEGALDKVLPTTEWTIEIPNQEALAEIINFMVDYKNDAGDNIFAPQRIYTDCPYASQVEFGTGPASKSMSDPVKIQRRLESIKKWIMDKGSVSDPAKAEKAAKSMIHHINQKGICPSPQFRSAINAVTDRLDGSGGRAEFILSGGSTKAIAEEIVAEVKRALNASSARQYGPETPLADSFTIEPILSQTTYNDGSVSVPASYADPTVSEDMWKDRSYRGRYGKPKSRAYR